MQSPAVGISSPLNTLDDDDDNELQNDIKQNDNNKSVYKQTANIWEECKEIIIFAIPVTLATIARITIYSTDTAFLGHLGTDELAGSALASTLAQFLYTFIFAPAYGLNSLCSQAIGAGNPRLSGNWLQLSCVISIIAIIPTVVIFFNVKPILGIIDSNDDVLYYASLFGKYASLFLLPTVLYMAIRQYFQAMQIVLPATVVSWISVGINILLNSILIHGLHINTNSININWNGLGFIGSPLATTCSITFQLLLFVSFTILYKRYPCKKHMWGGFTMKSFKKDRIIEFFKVIGPMTIGDASESWGIQVVVLSTATLPSKDVASINVVYQVWGMLWSVFWGIGLATIVRSGKTIGAGDIIGLKRVIKLSVILSTGVCGVIGLLCYFLRMNIAKVFTTDEEVLNLLDKALPILSLLFFTAGIGWPAIAVMEGMSRNTAKAIVYSGTAWFLYVPLALYLALYSPLKDKYSPVIIIWFTALFNEIIRVILIYIVLYNTNWEKEAENAKKRSEVLIKFKKDNTNKNDNNDKSVNLLVNDFSKIDEMDEEKQMKNEWRAKQSNEAYSLHETNN